MATAPPSPRSAARAREQILDAAESLFARKGLGPTTIKEIGAAAHQNPALLYYYFRSKAGLYRAVLHRLVSAMVARGGAALDASASPPDAIRALTRAQVEFLLNHPNAPKLLVRELIDHDARRAEALLLEVAAKLFDRLCRLIRLGQRKGRFRSDIEPRFAAISTVAQCVYFAVARPAIGLFFGQGTNGVSARTARAFAKHAGEFAVAALSRSGSRQEE
ncbi:MAG: TetR/AcrR family transcriptional regulator [Gemmatimonadales bacterium]